MDWVFVDLPLHPLFVHAAVILVPLTSLVAVIGAFWPTFRQRMGILTPILATAAALSVQLTVEAGEWLEEHVAETALVEAHASIGEIVTPWAALLVLVVWGQWVWYRFFAQPRGGREPRVTSPRALAASTAVLAVAVTVLAVGATVSTVIVGDSGARATWTDVAPTGGAGSPEPGSDSD